MPFLFLLLTLVFLIDFSTPAYGYLDPGTMGLAFQAFIAAAVGGIFAIKRYGQILVSFIRKLKK